MDKVSIIVEKLPEPTNSLSKLLVIFASVAKGMAELFKLCAQLNDDFILFRIQVLLLFSSSSLFAWQIFSFEKDFPSSASEKGQLRKKHRDSS